MEVVEGDGQGRASQRVCSWNRVLKKEGLEAEGRRRVKALGRGEGGCGEGQGRNCSHGGGP